MVNLNSKSTEQTFDWAQSLQSLAYAEQKPLLSGQIKVEPEDFLVTELMDVLPSGEGEHYWLDITKTQCNTDAVAKQLARFSNVAHRDVGYSGLKDFYAQTRQWFSVWKPKGGEPDWRSLKIPGVNVNQVIKHHRKIRRGTHRANRFEIKVRRLSGDCEYLEQDLERIKNQECQTILGFSVLGAMRKI